MVMRAAASGLMTAPLSRGPAGFGEAKEFERDHAMGPHQDLPPARPSDVKAGPRATRERAIPLPSPGEGFVVVGLCLCYYPFGNLANTFIPKPFAGNVRFGYKTDHHVCLPWGGRNSSGNDVVVAVMVGAVKD